jgi:hypothetical protein
MPVAARAFHWHPVRRTKKTASMHARSLTRGRPPPNRWVFLRTGSSGSIFRQSSSGIRKAFAAPSVRSDRWSSVTTLIQDLRGLFG